MPPTLEEDLVDGLGYKLVKGVPQLTRAWHAKDLEGDTPLNRFASALELDGAPFAGESLVINGDVLYCNDVDLKPWPPADAAITAVYLIDNPLVDDGGGGGGLGPVTIEYGVMLEAIDSAYDYANLAKPQAERSIITVAYDKDSTGAPGASAKKQGATVHAFIQKATRTYIRYQTVDPGTYADDIVGCTNSAPWKGYAAGVALCLEVRASYIPITPALGRWEARHVFGIDKKGKWKQVVRWYDSTKQEFPALSDGQVQASNGIKEVVVTGSYDFTTLSL